MTTEAGKRLLGEEWDNFDVKPWGSIADHIAAIEDEAREQACKHGHGWTLAEQQDHDDHDDGLRAEARAALLAELEEAIYQSLGHDLRELAQGAEKALHCIWPTMMLRALDAIHNFPLAPSRK